MRTNDKHSDGKLDSNAKLSTLIDSNRTKRRKIYSFVCKFPRSLDFEGRIDDSRKSFAMFEEFLRIFL